LVILTGDVEISRRGYRCIGCAAEVVPLDAALGLEPRTQHTLGVRGRGLWLVIEMPAGRLPTRYGRVDCTNGGIESGSR